MEYGQEHNAYTTLSNSIAKFKNYFYNSIKKDNLNSIKEDFLTDKKISSNYINTNDGNILHCVANSKDFDKEFTSFLLRYTNINGKDKYGRTPIHIAALNGNFDLFNFLLYNAPNLDPFVVDKKGENLLHYAAAGGNKNIIETLININIIDPNKADLEGRTPLHIAVLADNKEITDFLIDQPCILDMLPDINGNTIYDFIIFEDKEKERIKKEKEKQVEENNNFKEILALFSENDPSREDYQAAAQYFCGNNYEIAY